MIACCERPELTETRIHDLRRLVQRGTLEPIEQLRIRIVNEEEIMLRGRCACERTREMAEPIVLDAVPGATIVNGIEVVAELNPGLSYRDTALPSQRKR